MRLLNSIKNLIVGWCSQLFIILATFVTRYFFVKYLGTEYLGVSGLFSNILSLLSLAELGIGVAISYSLYKPLQENDSEMIKSIMRLFQKIYCTVGGIIIALGAIITPFLHLFIKNMPSDMPLIRVYFMLFVLNIGIAYFFSYKATLIIANQKKYIDELNYSIWFTTLNVCQIIILVITRSYLLYLILQVMFTLGQNICISHIANKQFPFLKEKKVEKLDKEHIEEIKKNTFAMMFQKLGSIVVNATDNIVLSKFVGLVSVGMYSNYYSIVSAVNMVVSQLFTAITASVGNLNISASPREMESVFQKSFFVNFWSYGCVSIVLYECLTPLVSIWLGEKYTLLPYVVLIVCVNFYFNGMRQAVQNFRNALGIYWQDKSKPIVESVLNLTISLFLVQFLGMEGVFIGTTLSVLIVTVWWEPHTLYKYGFSMSVGNFIKKYWQYTMVVALVGGVTHFLCKLILFNGILELLVKGVIAFLVSNALFLGVYHKNENFKGLLQMGCSLLNKKKEV